jgi:inward rectifier potassium channel
MAFNRSRFRSPEYDPGLSQKVDGELRRAIEHDGSFNVRRFGKRFEGLHLYQYLVTCSWREFLLWSGAFLIGVNLIFAAIYFFSGSGHLQGVPDCPQWQAFCYDFFFSVQTFSSVGYGAIAPRDLIGGFISSAEALFGLLCFALVTGLLFARFSRPSARILFSSMAIVSPYQDKTALMFRVINQRANVMVDMSADAIMSWVETVNGKVMRRFARLTLERPSIYFFPLPWTIVHPIDETSPLWGLDSDALAAKQAEVMILIRGYDDTFSQTVHTRNSYRFDEITFGRKFTPIFHVDDVGTVMVNVDLIDQTEAAVLAVEVNLEEM